MENNVEVEVIETILHLYDIHEEGISFCQISQRSGKQSGMGSVHAVSRLVVYKNTM